MNVNEDDPVMNQDQELRAKLCAVLLGEADEAARAEVEAALAGSEELRAERARLEATIGLVSSALKEVGGGASELSAGANAALEAAAAERARPTVWYRSNGFRIAASFAVFTGIVLAWKASVPGPTSSRTLGEMASAPQQREGDAPATGGEKKTDVATAPAEAAPEIVDRKSLPAAPADERLRFEQRAAKAGEVTGRDLAVIDGVEPPAAGPVEAVEEEIAELRDQQRGLRPGHSVYQEAELKIAKLEEAKQAFERGDADARVQLRELGYTLDSGQGAVHFGTGAPTASDSSNIASTPNANGGTTFTARVHTSGASGGSPPSSGKVAANNPWYATRSAAVPGAAAPARSAGGSGPSSPGPSGPVTRGAPTEPELRKLRELGYVSEPAKDNEVLGGAFDDDKNKSVTASDDYFLGQGGKRQLEPDWRSRFEQFRYDCRLLPRERPRDMFFRFWGDNPFELAALDKLSTFSADVDSASYTLARKYLAEGNLPEKAQIRTEEFVNYFKGDIAPPSEGVFRIATELAPSLFGDSSDTWMLRVAIRGRDVSKQERQPLALTFVIDVSGSMREESRLELVKHALRQLANQLDARDSIALVKFSTNAELVLPMTSAGQRTLIESAIQPLQPDGSTNTEAGLRMGYELASRSLAQNTTNRVVLLTDGVANVGIVDPNALVAMVESQRKAGIYLNTVGVGMDNHNDNLLEQLADKGDGLCNYVDDEKEVRRALVDNFTGAFEPIARDVKIQVEFDPAQVERYRLLGYENRAIADADFRNDKVDAGEINAGHQVVALYELVRRGANSGGSDAPLATLRLRYKQPFKAGVAGGNSDEATEIAQPVQARDAAGSFVATSPGYRRSVLVAQFAEFLRRSIHARYDSLDRLIDEAKKLAAELRDPEFDEFVAMVSRSRELVLRELNVRRPPIDRCFDELRHRAYLLQQIDELERRFASQSRIDELDRNARDLDRQLDELRNKLESLQGQVDDETLARIQAENIELQRKLIELLERTRASKVK